MNIVYSTQRSGFLPGVIYRNPRYFQRPMAEGATRVTVVGDWPAVVAAYEAQGVPVEVVTAGATAPDRSSSGDHHDDARDALRAEYEALTGEKPDKRWGEKRLREAIDEVRRDA